MADTGHVAPEWGRFELANVRLLRIRSRHYRIPDPSIFSNKAGVCESDRHRWPCHASTLLGAIVEVLKLTRDGNDRDLDPAAVVTVGALREALIRGLLAEEGGGGV